MVRNDLPVNYRSVQAAHSAIQFQHEHPEIANDWHIKSKTLALLTSIDEEHLIDLIYKAERKNIKYSIFREPDIGNEITSVTFDPSDISRRLVSNLPLLNNE